MTNAKVHEGFRVDKKVEEHWPNSYNHLGAFYVTCFARLCEILTAVVSELQSGPHAVL